MVPPWWSSTEDGLLLTGLPLSILYIISVETFKHETINYYKLFGVVVELGVYKNVYFAKKKWKYPNTVGFSSTSIWVTSCSDSRTPLFGAKFDPNGHKRLIGQKCKYGVPARNIKCWKSRKIFFFFKKSSEKCFVNKKLDI